MHVRPFAGTIARMPHLDLTRTQLDALVLVVSILIAVLAGLVIHRVLYWALERMADRRHSVFAEAVIRRTCRPASFILPLLAILATVPNLTLPENWPVPVLRVTGLVTIGAIAWAIITTIQLWSDLVVARHRIDVEDNLLARQLGTRVDILTRAAVIVVIIIAVGMELMTFPEVRTIGTTLLASAGLAGIHPRRPMSCSADLRLNIRMARAADVEGNDHGKRDRRRSAAAGGGPGHLAGAAGRAAAGGAA